MILYTIYKVYIILYRVDNIYAIIREYIHIDIP